MEKDPVGIIPEITPDILSNTLANVVCAGAPVLIETGGLELSFEYQSYLYKIAVQCCPNNIIPFPIKIKPPKKDEPKAH